MSYMRGDIYVWRDADENVHIWSAEGNDGWQDSVWGDGRGETASGVAMPCDAFDELVAMRLGELIGEGKLRATIRRTLQKWESHGGCASLAKFLDQLARLEDG